MKKTDPTFRTTLYLLIISLTLLCCNAFAQSCSNPITVDLSQHADTSVTITALRSGNCCTGSNCTVFAITINPGTDLISLTTSQVTGSTTYTVNCGTPEPEGTATCVSGMTTFQIAYCKPGNNAVTYTITAASAVHASGNLNLRVGCSGTMSVTGLTTASTTWTSIYPGATGAYNSYLSQTSGATSVTVTPQTGAPAYIDYQVSGTQSGVCGTTKTETIRVYTYPALTVSISPATVSICSGSSVTLTATGVGGSPASSGYTYSWSNGATTQSITTSTTGTYTVSVNDQLACGPVTQSVSVGPFTPAPPTAAGATICTGTTATLTATAPGGIYQWYDASTNGNLLYTGSSFTTPVLSSNTTYYVQDSNGSCTSSRTPVTVTVNPLPAKPAIQNQ